MNTISEINALLDGKFDIAQANKPTLHELLGALLGLGTQGSKRRLSFFENDEGIVSLVEGPYHFSLWGGLPVIGKKMLTVKFRGMAEHKLADRMIASQVL